MATVNEGLLRVGNWIIMYDLGATALRGTYGSHVAAYQDIYRIMTNLGFVRIQYSAYRHPNGCMLLHACIAIVLISNLPWVAGNFQGNLHVRDLRIAIQGSAAMVMTPFVRGVLSRLYHYGEVDN
jgi:virulence-associated protein VapD